MQQLEVAAEPERLAQRAAEAGLVVAGLAPLEGLPASLHDLLHGLLHLFAVQRPLRQPAAPNLAVLPARLKGVDQLCVPVDGEVGVVGGDKDLAGLLGCPQQRHQLAVYELVVDLVLGLVDQDRLIASGEGERQDRSAVLANREPLPEDPSVGSVPTAEEHLCNIGQPEAQHLAASLPGDVPRNNGPVAGAEPKSRELGRLLISIEGLDPANDRRDPESSLADLAGLITKLSDGVFAEGAQVDPFLELQAEWFQVIEGTDGHFDVGRPGVGVRHPATQLGGHLGERLVALPTPLREPAGVRNEAGDAPQGQQRLGVPRPAR